MNKSELELLDYVFRLAIGECYTEEIDDICKLQEKVINQDNIIKEVREYIQDRYDGEVLTHTFDKDNVGELLDILKGSNKE